MHVTSIRTLAPGALALLIVFAAACGDDDGGDGESEDRATAVSADQLDGRTFVSTEVTGQTLVEGTVVTLVFEDGNVGATAGCNTMTGGFTVEDGVLQVDQLAQTLMACPDDLQAQDEWVAALLTSGPVLSLDGDTLTVTGDDVTLTLADEAGGAEEPSIDGSSWKITTLDGPEGTLTAPEGASLTIAEGRLNVATGCNTGFGDVTVGEGTITVGPLATTRMACESELMEWEGALLSFLDGELGFELAEDALTLSKDDATLSLEPLV
jgi:heat shock protein HslJ